MLTKIPFSAADIMLPKTGFERWSCVACDQYTSEPDYWDAVRDFVGDMPSTLNIMLPELYLGKPDTDARIDSINMTMKEYIEGNIFDTYRNVLVYVERTLDNGAVRHGLVGKLDLEDYDYSPDSKSLIRATEGTVLSRIPPRVRIRENAPLELPHIMVLINDEKMTCIEPLAEKTMKTLYDFELMMGGGHLRGSLVDPVAYDGLFKSLAALAGDDDSPLLFAMGDGNHSLATAKACYENEKKRTGRTDIPSRYALVELVNIHDPALVFEPIYRVVFGVDAKRLAAEFAAHFGTGDDILLIGQEMQLGFKAEGILSAAVQDFIDGYIERNPGASVDYIHGEDSVRKLISADENSVGFLFGGIGKNQLFDYVANNGPLPRKTFSMGEASSKRFYTEARMLY